MRSTDSVADTDRTTPGRRSAVDRILPWVMLLGGLIGLAASTVLTVDKIRLETDPAYAPSCNINATVSCGSIMQSSQAAVLGFPNSFMGVGGFTIVAMIGVALLLRQHLDRVLWGAVQVGVTAAVVFVHWLIVQSLYVIGALCPYCMVVWAVTVPIFWYVTLWNLTLWGPGRSSGSDAVGTLLRYHWVPVAAWYVAVVSLVWIRFGASIF